MLTQFFKLTSFSLILISLLANASLLLSLKTISYLGVEINFDELEQTENGEPNSLATINFRLKFSIPNDLASDQNNNFWLALGFNTQPKMDKANVIVCKSLFSNSTFSVEHYYNDGFSPVKIDQSNAQIGILNSSMSINQNQMTCSFSRQNNIVQKNSLNYYDISKLDVFVLVAYGKISTNNRLMYHGSENRFASLNPISFTKTKNNDSLIQQTTLKLEDNQSSMKSQFTSSVLLSSSEPFLSSTTVDSAFPTSIDQLIDRNLSLANNQHTPSLTSVTPTFLTGTNELIETTQIIQQTMQSNFSTGKTLLLSGATINYEYGQIESNFSISFQLPDGLKNRNAFWIGLGFNSVEDMDGASVAICKYNLVSNTFTIQHYFNSEEYNPIILDQTQPSIGLTNQYLSFSNGRLICSFTRSNSISINKQYLKSADDLQRYFDLSLSNPHLLIAYGEMATSSDGKIQYHGPNQRDATQTPIRINSQLLIGTTTMPIFSTNYLINSNNNSGIFYGSYKIGSFKLNWIDTQTYTDFTLQSTSSSNNNNNIYIALGFSFDQKMGNDGVVYCSYSNNIYSVVQAYNDGKVRPQPLVQNDKSIGLSNLNVKFENENFVCAFRRSKTMINIQNYFNLNVKYYLLFAKGPVSTSGNIEYHTERIYSTSQIDLQSNITKSDESTINNDKLKAHGSLMVIAWILIASNGILMPKYYKFLLPEIRWFNLQFWFNMHRPLMCCVPVFSIVSLIVILADLDWKWIDMKENSLSFTHSIFGIVTIGFSVIQIPMGFFRPSLTSKKRYIFNFFHKLIGSSTYLFSIIALFIGVCIPRTHIDRNGWIIMLSWTLYSIFLPCLIEFLELCASRTKSDKYEVTNSNEVVAESSARSQRKLEIVKSILLSFHLIISLGITIGLIYVIAAAKG